MSEHSRSDLSTLQLLRFANNLLGLLVLNALFVLCVSLVAERLLLLYASTYPHWLASGSLDSLSPQSMSRLRKTHCNATGVSVMEKPTHWVFRCGDFWPGSKTFLAPRSTANDKLVNSPTAFD